MTSIAESKILEGPFIFLDVDGVLAMSRCQTLDFDEDDETLFFPKQIEGGDFIPPLEKMQLTNLALVIKECNAKIVLSSTWRGILVRTLQSENLYEFNTCNAIKDLTK